MAEWIADMYAGLFQSMIGLGDEISTIVSCDGSSTMGQVSASIMNACIKNIMPSLEAVALAISVTFFLIALLELSTTERLTLEFFIKFFSKLVIAIALIFNMGTLTQGCIDFGDSMSSLLANVETSAYSVDAEHDITSSEYLEEIISENTGFLGMVVLMLQSVVTIIPFKIVATVIIAVTWIISFTRILEMGVRACFMPIAIALLSDDGWKGAGGRYIRKFIAICTQGAVLVMIAKLTGLAMATCASIQVQSIATGGIDELAGGAVVFLGVGIASVSMMFKSIGIVNDAFGA